MKEYTDRVSKILNAVNNSSSSRLFAMIEEELNTRITAVIGGKRVYGGKLYTSRIKIEGIVLCSEYNVLRANYNYISFALKIITEKMKLEKVTELYRKVVRSALEGLTPNEYKGVKHTLAVMMDIEDKVVISDVAVKNSLTRSVIINGLKKLECAGIIEMYSCGAKGTNIKLLYPNIKSIITGERGD